MMKHWKNCLLVLSLISLIGCASNGYREFYQAVPGAMPEVIAHSRAGPPPVKPIVERASSEPDLLQYELRGYQVIGRSSFNSGRRETEEAAIEQAQAVRADLVLILNPKYTNTVNSNISLTTPKVTTSFTSGTATAYGSGGSATAYGQSTTTTYGTEKTNIPISVRRYDYGAIYFVKQKFSLGVIWRELTDQERRSMGSNAGVFVRTVVLDSPAFRADILPGDVLLAVNGEAIYGVSEASERIAECSGTLIRLTLLREEKAIDISVQL